MNTYDLSLEFKFCLNCKKLVCKGSCQEYREYMRNLRDNHLIPKRGRPKKEPKQEV